MAASKETVLWVALSEQCTWAPLSVKSTCRSLCFTHLNLEYAGPDQLLGFPQEIFPLLGCDALTLSVTTLISVELHPHPQIRGELCFSPNYTVLMSLFLLVVSDSHCNFG